MPKIWELIVGHVFLAVGCYLTAWGIYLVPQGLPGLLYIFARPLFWGLISILGGLCLLFIRHIKGTAK